MTEESSMLAPETTDRSYGATAVATAPKRYAVAGQTLCVLHPAQDVFTTPLSAFTGGERSASIDGCAAVSGGPASAQMWPEDCPEVVVLDSPEGGCYVVDITVPCSTPFLSPSLLEGYERRAVRRIISEIQPSE